MTDDPTTSRAQRRQAVDDGDGTLGLDPFGVGNGGVFKGGDR